MTKTLMTLVASGLMLVAGSNSAVAQDEEEMNAAAPVELYTCKYNEGKGPADLDKVVAKWNKWADGHEMSDYSAWTLTPYFAGDEQDFDVAWLGVSPTGKGLGAGLDAWLADGSALQAEFDSIAPCDSHSMFAAVEFKQPPKRKDPSKVVISFSDCSIKEGKTFDDVAAALGSWSEFRSGQGSTAGMWVFFPVYGGGGEEFDFKYVASYGSFEELGVDYDNYDSDKADELFSGLVDCDSSRVYIATNRRTMAEEEE